MHFAHSWLHWCKIWLTVQPCLGRYDGSTCEIRLIMMYLCIPDSGHNGHKPKRPKPKRPQTGTVTDRNGHKRKRPQTETATDRNGHKPKRPQTETATNRNGHRPERPQTETATNRNGHKPERPQTGTAANRNRHNYIWFSLLQICVRNRSFKLVSRSRQK